MTTSTSPWAPDFDYLCAGAALIARIREQLPQLHSVESQASLASIKDGAFLDTPCALVYWAGETAVENDDETGPQRTEQVWIVELVGSAPNDKTGEQARLEVGPLIAPLVRAVRGWAPYEGFQPFSRVQGTQPSVEPGGVLYVPLAFKTSFIV